MFQNYIKNIISYNSLYNIMTSLTPEKQRQEEA